MWSSLLWFRDLHYLLFYVNVENINSLVFLLDSLYQVAENKTALKNSQFPNSKPVRLSMRYLFFTEHQSRIYIYLLVLLP